MRCPSLWPSHIFKSLSVSDQIGEACFQAKFENFWKPLCDNPLIKLDLQDVFSTLEDEDDVVYDYAGAKGENEVLFWLEYLMSTCIRKNYHNYLKCKMNKMKMINEDSQAEILLFSQVENFLSSHIYESDLSQFFCVTAL